MLEPHPINGTPAVAIFSRLLESGQGSMSAELAYYILDMGFSVEDKARMRGRAWLRRSR